MATILEVLLSVGGEFASLWREPHRRIWLFSYALLGLCALATILAIAS